MLLLLLLLLLFYHHFCKHTSLSWSCNAVKYSWNIHYTWIHTSYLWPGISTEMLQVSDHPRYQSRHTDTGRSSLMVVDKRKPTGQILLGCFMTCNTRVIDSIVKRILWRTTVANVWLVFKNIHIPFKVPLVKIIHSAAWPLWVTFEDAIQIFVVYVYGTWYSNKTDTLYIVPIVNNLLSDL